MKRGFLSALSPQSRGFSLVASCHQFLNFEFDESTLRVSIPTSIDGAAAASSAFRPLVPSLSNPNHLPFPLHGNHPSPSDVCTTISGDGEEDDVFEDEEDDELPDAFDELFCEDLLFESLENYFSEGFNRLVEETNSTTTFVATTTTTDQTSSPNTLAIEEFPLEISPSPPTNKSKSEMVNVCLSKYTIDLSLNHLPTITSLDLKICNITGPSKSPTNQMTPHPLKGSLELGIGVWTTDLTPPDLDRFLFELNQGNEIIVGSRKKLLEEQPETKLPSRPPDEGYYLEGMSFIWYGLLNQEDIERLKSVGMGDKSFDFSYSKDQPHVASGVFVFLLLIAHFASWWNWSEF